MSSKHKAQRDQWTAIIAGERLTASFAARALARAGVSGTSLIAPSGKGHANTLADGPGCLLVIPAPELGPAQLALAEQAVGRGCLVLTWSNAAHAGTEAADELQLLEALLDQAGALASSRLEVLALAARIHTALGGPFSGTLQLKAKQRSSLAARLVAFAAAAGIAESSSRTSWRIEVNATSGALTLSGQLGEPLELGDPEVAMAALALLASAPPAPATAPAGGLPAPSPEIDAIARPPRRLLSETTSKRLIRCFGLATPEEYLCKSPSEAVRVATQLGVPVVLKLVRPEFSGKAAAGAVLTDLDGAPAVKRGFHSLLALDAELGLPRALGVLVGTRVDGGDRFWLCMHDDARYGRCLHVGLGDSPTTAPTLVLHRSASRAAIDHVVSAKLHLKEDRATKLTAALGSALHLASFLDQRILRFEIHPLVVHERYAAALALDALVEIAD